MKIIDEETNLASFAPHEGVLLYKVTQISQMTQIFSLLFYVQYKKRIVVKSASSANWKSAAEGKAKSAWP